MFLHPLKTFCWILTSVNYGRPHLWHPVFNLQLFNCNYLSINPRSLNQIHWELNIDVRKIPADHLQTVIVHCLKNQNINDNAANASCYFPSNDIPDDLMVYDWLNSLSASIWQKLFIIRRFGHTGKNKIFMPLF